jgi:hypothetical protein
MMPVISIGFDRSVKPFDALQLLLINRVKADGTSDPFEIVRSAEVVQDAREAKHL